MGSGNIVFGTIICCLFLAADTAGVQWAARHKQTYVATDNFMTGFMFFLVGTGPLTRAFMKGEHTVLTWSLIVIIVGYGVFAFLRGYMYSNQPYGTVKPIVSLRRARIRTLCNSIVLAAVCAFDLMV